MRARRRDVFIGLGSNLGDREGAIRRALEWLDNHPNIEVLSFSALRETAPWGVVDQPPFINAVALVCTSLEPRALLLALKHGETVLGRRPKSRRWGPREIDMDILLFEQEIVDEPDLKIPHPCLVLRDFAMEQIVEIDGDIIHPELGVPLRRLIPRRGQRDGD